MPRLMTLLIALIAILGAGLAWVALRPAPTVITEAQVRAIVDEAIAATPAPLTEAQVRDVVGEAIAAEPAPLTDQSVKDLITAALAERDAKIPQSRTVDAATLNPMIEDYLLSNPRILQRLSDALEAEIRNAEAEQAKAAITSMHAEIYDDPDHVILGNPNGDVTLVEMFDYNCHYCRQALPDLAVLLAEDTNLRVILKEFPILSQESIDAARIGILVSEAKGVDYWSFHQKLFTSRGLVTQQTALDAAKDLGLNPIELQLEAGTPRITAILDKSYAIARNLNVSGTPTYIIGDEIIAGAVGIDQLRLRIANMRACGKTDCTVPDTADNSAPTPPGNG
jgi:protein-disulfide isomerase